MTADDPTDTDASRTADEPGFTAQQFAAMDDYLERTLIHPDPQFAQIRQAGEDAGMPPIEVSAAQGKLRHLLATISGARRVLEIGTLAGYSTAWLARAVGDGGQVRTCEFEPLHAETARKNLDSAGVGDRVE